MTRAVLIVRPQPGAGETADRARARGLEPVVAPMFSVRALEWTAPPAGGFDAVLFTSANAPRNGGQALASFRGLPCYAVGEATAYAAAEAGFGHVRTGPSDGAAVVEMMARDGAKRAFHPTAPETTALTPADGLEIVQVPVYTAEPAERLSDVAVAAIHAGAVVLLHSPRAGGLFSDQIGERRARTRIAAISDAAAAAAGVGWAGVAVAAEPRDEALLVAAEELADAELAQDPLPPPAAVPPPTSVQEPAGPRRSWVAPLLVGLTAFLLGIAVMALVLGRWGAAAGYFGLAPAEQAEAATDQQGSLLQPLPPAPNAALAQRLAALEQRLGELGSNTQAAAGNADRAEGLLVAFAARRALERGLGLGYLEGLLRQRFGAAQPEAVGTIIDFSQQPVTLQQLQTELDEAGPRLTGVAPGQGFWQALSTEAANLIIVRREGTQSTDPTRRLNRATRLIEGAQVEQALQEVLRLPGRENGRQWIDRAQRYVAARQALDAIELAAFVEPRTPPPQQQPAQPTPVQPQQAPAR